MATLSLTDFRARFPEFRPVADAQVIATLASAHVLLSEEAYGVAYTLAVGLLAADLLMSSPFGNGMRSESSAAPELTTYRVQLNLIDQGLPMRAMVLA